ncbi:MAG TPA: hypothetical protein PKA10_06265 [Selenomonadales bacterium]|nr:hypothetical protein [Selenomonadales bacterium]
MPRKRWQRQFITVPGTATPIPIPTEAFLELNPELEEFVEEVYPYKIFPQTPAYYYGSGSVKSPQSNNAAYSACTPRRFCLPYPCNPV